MVAFNKCCAGVSEAFDPTILLLLTPIIFYDIDRAMRIKYSKLYTFISL